MTYINELVRLALAATPIRPDIVSMDWGIGELCGCARECTVDLRILTYLSIIGRLQTAPTWKNRRSRS